MPGGRRCSGEKYDNDDVLYSSASCRSLSEVSYSTYKSTTRKGSPFFGYFRIINGVILMCQQTISNCSSNNIILWTFLHCCGACGYQLNLSSCNRDIPAMCSKYEKSLKKGVVPFFSIDESRFTQREELRCKPFYVSRHSWGLFQRRIKLLCGKCGNYIGFACTGKPAHRSFNGTFSKSVSLSGNGLSDDRIYNIKLGSVQPCTNDHDL